MTYYTEVTKTNRRLPTVLITNCLKCRLLELQECDTPKISALVHKHKDQFNEYLEKSTNETAIINILNEEKISFLLQKPTYLIHSYDDGDTFAQDMIEGFVYGRYNGESLFGTLSHVDVSKHSRVGYHLRNRKKFGKRVNPQDFAYYANELLDCNNLNVERYGEDLMDYACACSSESFVQLRINLLRKGINPFEALCKLAAQNGKIFDEVIFSYEQHGIHINMTRRNKDVALNCQYIHPDHRRIGMNIPEIMIFLNTGFYLNQMTINLSKADDEDLALLAKSLKYWLSHVQSPKEFHLITSRIEYLESVYFAVNLELPEIIRIPRPSQKVIVLPYLIFPD